jgi:hypothetical protein
MVITIPFTTIIITVTTDIRDGMEADIIHIIPTIPIRIPNRMLLLHAGRLTAPFPTITGEPVKPGP